jgi:nucleoside-diphosphate-sugar epimerase
VVALNILALESDNSASRGKWYNACFGDRTTIVTVGETIIDSLWSESQLVYAPARKWDIQDSFGDNQLAKELLWYEPQHSIQNGIQKTIKRYTQNTEYFSA